MQIRQPTTPEKAQKAPSDKINRTSGSLGDPTQQRMIQNPMKGQDAARFVQSLKEKAIEDNGLIFVSQLMIKLAKERQEIGSPQGELMKIETTVNTQVKGQTV